MRDPFDWLTPETGINALYQLRAAVLENRIPVELHQIVIGKLMTIVESKAPAPRRILAARILMEGSAPHLFRRPKRETASLKRARRAAAWDAPMTDLTDEKKGAARCCKQQGEQVPTPAAEASVAGVGGHPKTGPGPGRLHT